MLESLLLTVSLCFQTLGVPVQPDPVVRGLRGAPVGGPVERGSVRGHGGHQRSAGRPLWAQRDERHAGAGPGSGLLPEQGEAGPGVL